MKITKAYPVMNKKYLSIKLSQIEKIEGRKKIIKKFNYDPEILNHLSIAE